MSPEVRTSVPRNLKETPVKADDTRLEGQDRYSWHLLSAYYITGRGVRTVHFNQTLKRYKIHDLSFKGAQPTLVIMTKEADNRISDIILGRWLQSAFGQRKAMIVVTEKSFPILKNLCLALLHFGTLIWIWHWLSSGSNVPVCIIGFQWQSNVSNSQRCWLYETYPASSHINHRLLYHSQWYCCTVERFMDSIHRYNANSSAHQERWDSSNIINEICIVQVLWWD